VIALCDRVRTEQVFWNLINNAIKFSPRRREHPGAVGTRG